MKSALGSLVLALVALAVLGAIVLGIAACVVASSWSSSDDGFLGECSYAAYMSGHDGCDSEPSAPADVSSGTGYEPILKLQSSIDRRTSKRCVVATVTDAETRSPVADESVRFSVPAALGQARPRRGSEDTDQLGQASFCSTPTPPYASKRIHAFIDLDFNGREDKGEPGDSG